MKFPIPTDEECLTFTGFTRTVVQHLMHKIGVYDSYGVLSALIVMHMNCTDDQARFIMRMWFDEVRPDTTCREKMHKALNAYFKVNLSQPERRLMYQHLQFKHVTAIVDGTPIYMYVRGDKNT